ncbi:aminotransferase class III-fold pyridoxal phosphate-dependent enzyme [Candidatus Uabimicrobium sp. HlEnr_7]|uniref:aminotransferase class III-fold pyridoxal phosphate-dependent enzyme n=1 Tax=Candidatus Uabimicrobium helgolandensis TaxID=3095367 RepID=UPI003555D710
MIDVQPIVQELVNATFGHLENDYTIRHVKLVDLEWLYVLEKLCWKKLKSSDEDIRNRIKNYPQGQFVLCYRDSIVGVVYSQRIQSVKQLEGKTSVTVCELHDASASIVQLLAVNIDPGAQNLELGNFLLEFILRYYEEIGIKSIVGVTLCKNYDTKKSLSFLEYIEKRNKYGNTEDPILFFHESHGATIEGVLPNYRSLDTANECYGVLVRYNLLNRSSLQKIDTKKSKCKSTAYTTKEIYTYLEEIVKSALGEKQGNFSLSSPLMEMGLDSLDLLVLQDKISHNYNIELESEFFFQYNTLKKVENYLIEALIIEQQEITNIISTQKQPTHKLGTQDIAIVGMACKLPGGIETPEELWQILKNGENVISQCPEGRVAWPQDINPMIRKAINYGGFISNVESFDANLFRISPREAEYMDPQQRILLELSWSCLENAGVNIEESTNEDTGVFIGASGSDYTRLLQEEGVEASPHYPVGSSLALLANRISYFFNFCGPSMQIDTACSSSLVAVHNAVQAIQRQECSQALVGGINIICHPANSIAYQQAGMLAPDGKCKTFDAKANGYVRSEGAVVLLLKPLDVAQQDHDFIHAVIKGSAVNHGGLSGGVTVPNPEKQAELLVGAWKNSRIAPEDLSYLEAHGTGTSLGDPIEISGIQKAFHLSSTTKSCGVGSLKTNLGHLEAAAGIAGLLKLVLCLKYKELPASIYFQNLNPKIDLKKSLHIVDKYQKWNANHDLLCAGVSSFGSGGTNAHIVVEEHTPMSYCTFPAEDVYLFTLSAKNIDSLRNYVKKILTWTNEHQHSTLFMDFIYTLQISRTNMTERLAMKVRSFSDLQYKLRKWLSEKIPENCWQKNISQSQGELKNLPQGNALHEYIKNATEEQNLQQLSKLWILGIDINWRSLYKNLPQKIPIVTYPFSRKKHWIEAKRLSSRSGVHPLLHENTSNLSEQRFTSTFTGQESFLQDHHINKQKVLPAVAYLEMVRVAVKKSLGKSRKDMVVIIKNSVWIQPFIVEDVSSELHIRLSPSNDEEIIYEVYTQCEEKRVVYTQGSATLQKKAELRTLDITKLKSQASQKIIEASRCYQNFMSSGMIYGPKHRGIERIFYTENQAIAKLHLPITEADNEYVIHPGLVDSALQSAIQFVITHRLQYGQYLPFTLGEIRILKSCTEEMYAWVRYANNNSSLDIDLCDKEGRVCIEIRELAFRMLSEVANTNEQSVLLSTPVWEHQPHREQIAEKRDLHHFVVLCEISGDKHQLQNLLTQSECCELHSQKQSIALRYTEYATRCMQLIKEILNKNFAKKIVVQVVVPCAPESSLLTGISGVLRTAMLENTKIVGQIISIADEEISKDLAYKLNKEKDNLDDFAIKYEQKKRFVLTWQQLSDSTKEVTFQFEDNSLYLITGGLGGLGFLFAKHIFSQTNNTKLVVVGRSKLCTQKELQVQELQGEVSYHSLDISNLEEVDALVKSIKKESNPLRGVIHGAGIISDNLMINKTAEEFKKVFAPKVTGTINLDTATKDIVLDFFVLFSSSMGVIGNVGQADYASANAFMDQFAAYRKTLVSQQQRFGKTVSIAWPLWENGGMKVEKSTEIMMKKTWGIIPMKTSIGIEAFYKSLSYDYPQILVMTGVLAKIKECLALHTVEKIPQKTSNDGSKKIRTILVQIASTTSKIEECHIDSSMELSEYGFDSITFTEFANQLNERYDLNLTPAIFFEYPTIDELTNYLISEFESSFTTEFSIPVISEDELFTQEVSKSTQLNTFREIRPLHTMVPENGNEAVAIVGMSGCFPGAKNIEQFWKNLVTGKNCISEIPENRWDWREHYGDPTQESNKTDIIWGGFMENIAEFDPLFFKISPQEAKLMDPQQRLLMMHVYHALEDAGYSASELSGSNTGIFVGMTSSDYKTLIAKANLPIEGYSFTGMLPSMGPNRMSYFLNLHGPSEPIETACSSSLVAIHRAVQSINTGNCDAALVGGVNTMITPEAHISFGKAGMLSKDGKCKTFSSNANGYARGEGIGVLFLKKLTQAEIDGDHIYGVVRGSSENHGGRTVSLTAPSPRAQAEVIKAAHLKSQLDPRTITYIETHGTGTPLGDEVELNGLKMAFEDLYKQENVNNHLTSHCAIASLKTNIGHLEFAAGIAGVIKILLQFKYEKLVKSLHCNEVNPHLDLENSPFYILKENQKWIRIKDDFGHEIPKRAGVSSFGIGGVNAHVVLEEYNRPERLSAEIKVSAIVPLSAKTRKQLKQRAQDLLDYLCLNKEDIPIDLSSVAYTLQVGREAMKERLAIVAESVDDLKEGLRRFLSDDQAENIYLGTVHGNERAQPSLDLYIQQKKLINVAELWVNGSLVNWLKFYDTKQQRISLPTYPFDKENYWVTDSNFLCQDLKKTDLTKTKYTLLKTIERQQLDEKQEDFIRQLSNQYSQFTIKSKELSEQFHRVFADPRRPLHFIKMLKDFHYPLTYEKGEKAYVFDIDGNKYIDISCDMGVNLLGHQATCIQKAIEESLNKGVYLTGYSKKIGETAELFKEMTGFERVMFAQSGTEAVMWAVRLARAATGKNKIVIFEEAYHGLADVVLASKGQEGSSVPKAPGLQQSYADDLIVLDYGEEQQLQIIAEQENIAAVLIEPVPSRHPYLQPCEYLQKIRAITRERGIALIFDEMITGFRVHPQGAQGYFGVQADIATYGKLVSGGIPTGVVAGSSKYMDWVDGGQWSFHDDSIPGLQRTVTGGTHAKNPLKIDTMYAILSELKEQGPKLQKDLNVKTQGLVQQLNNLFDKKRIPIKVECFGSLFRFRFLDYYFGLTEALFFYLLRMHGVETFVQGNCFLTTTHTDEDINEIVIAVENSLDILLEQRFFYDTLSLQNGNNVAENLSSDISCENIVNDLKLMMVDVLGIALENIDEEEDFSYMGVDSIIAINLAIIISQKYTIEFSSVKLATSNTITKLSQTLFTDYNEVFVKNAAPSKEKCASKNIEISVSDEVPQNDIAIVGMSASLPNAPNLEIFWKNLISGQNSISEIPKSRWDWQKYYSENREVGKTKSKWAALLENISEFDLSPFQISPEEAKSIDPQEKIVITEIYKALQDANIPIKILAGSKTGVFIGYEYSEHQQYLQQIRNKDQLPLSSSIASYYLANRVSYLLDLRGPSEAINVNCASSAVSINRAYYSLLNYESDIAIAGGVCLHLFPEDYIATSKLLSADGSCGVFDQNANGYTRGEGCGIVILKRLNDAKRDGDYIYATIKSSCQNNRGFAKTISHINPSSITNVMKDCYKRVNIDPKTIRYIEVDGYCTKKGDALEYQGIKQVFMNNLSAFEKHCALGSVKGNIGHLEPASGVVSVIKIALAMSHKLFPRTITCKTMSELIDIKSSTHPLYFANRNLHFDELGECPIRAGVNSFADSGVNVHILLEESPSKPQNRTRPTK